MSFFHILSVGTVLLWIPKLIDLGRLINQYIKGEIPAISGYLLWVGFCFVGIGIVCSLWLVRIIGKMLGI